MNLGGPHVPSPGLAGFFKGRIPRMRGSTVVEREVGGTWREVARYASSIDAKLAVDQAIADGSDPGSLRVVEAQTSGVLVIVGALAIVLAAAIVLYIVFG
jgi:hypothetical protein